MLIKAYNEYLSEDYLNFQKELLDKISNVNILGDIWEIFTLSKNVWLVIAQIEKIRDICVSEVFDKYVIQLNELHITISELETKLRNKLTDFRLKAQNMLVSKRALISVSIDLELDELFEIKRIYDEAFKKVNDVISLVNEFIDKIKLNSNIENFETDNTEKIREIDNKIQRITEEDYCKNWENQYNLVSEKADEKKVKSDDMQENQKNYLANLFDKIDGYFRLYGGTKFKIENGEISNRGNKKTIGITIKFKNQLITENTDRIFSESDKRALALAVFMAKLDCIDTEEKKKTIVVFDDPITSFDDNRMKNVEMSIIGNSRFVDQTFIMTHNFSFAKAIADKYDEGINYYGIDRISADNHGLYDLNPEEYFTDGFNKKFNKIMSSNNCESNDMSENDLRIFLEEYLAVVFAKHYKEHDIGALKLGERIDKLKELRLISDDVNVRLHAYRNELNSGSHTFNGTTIEDDRLFSISFMEYLFDKVRMK